MILFTMFAKFFKQKFEVYDSIHTMPLQVWLKIHETGDLSLLLLSGKCKAQTLQDIWLKVRDEHLQEFGVNDSLRRFLNLRTMQIYAECDYGLNPDSLNDVKRKIADSDMENFLNENGEYKFSDSHMAIQKYMGFKMSLTDTTVYEFYAAAKLMQNELKKK